MSTLHSDIFSSRPARSTRTRKPGFPKKMTEEEFVEWCDEGTRAEWLNGEVIIMNAVNFGHADVVGFLHHLLRAFVDEHELGKVVSEPFQVRFAKLKHRRSPDIQFFSESRLHLITNSAFDGAPDLIVEVISPDSQTRDRRVKYLEYEAVGVKEYWIVDPASYTFELYVLGKNGKYTAVPLVDRAVHSAVLRGLFIRPDWLWQPKFPKVSAILKEMAKKR